MNDSGHATRRLLAAVALLAMAASAVLVVWAALTSLPYGLIGAVLLVLACGSGLYGLLHTGGARTLAWVVGALLVVAAVVLHVIHHVDRAGLAAVVALVVSVEATRRAVRVHLRLPPVPPPDHPVVVWNPRSGGGKALAANLADEARKRGIEPIELQPGDDLEDLVRGAVASGADGLMAAGGDGTQALVAGIAAEHDLPFACIPAGTRNHFALDLGVDRDDVVGALDAFVDGGEKRVDLAVVNGRVFVNNVSLGVYAEAVRRPGYREAKLRSLVAAAPEVTSGGGHATTLRWQGRDGRPEEKGAVLLISNNPYRLGPRLGNGTRPRLDLGVLGVTVAGAVGAEDGRRSLAEQWTTPEFVVDADGAVPVGVDGEALTLPAPVTFQSRPAALRVRIAPSHPGVSPSYVLPPRPLGLVGLLLTVVAGKDPLEQRS